MSSVVVKAAAVATNATTNCRDPKAPPSTTTSTLPVCGCPVTLTKGKPRGDGCPSTGSADAATTCVNCDDGFTMSQWWLETGEVVGDIVENVRCKDITVGASKAHFVGQSPCCMVQRLVTDMSTLLTSHEFTETEKTGFWAHLVGDDTRTLTWSDKTEVENAFREYIALNCDNIPDSNNQITTTAVDNLLLGVDSSVSCNELQVAVSDTSQTVVCVINGVHAAQCAMSPDSCKAPPSTSNKGLPAVAWVGIGVGSVVLLLAVARLIAWALHKRDTRLSAEGVLMKDAAARRLWSGERVAPELATETEVANELRGRVGDGW